MQVAALSVWLRGQALPWLAGLGVLAVRPALAHTAVVTGVVAAAIALSFGALVLLLRCGGRLADVATIARAAGMVAVFAAAGRPVAWPAWLLLVACVAADLLDGALARRHGGSPQGAVLDMEADQFVVLALAVLVVGGGGGVHVLALPALRYAFVLAAWWLRIPAHDPKPVDGDNRRGRAICAAVMVALLAALLPGLPVLAGDLLTAAALALLSWSFAADGRHLVRQLRARRSAA